MAATRRFRARFARSSQRVAGRSKDVAQSSTGSSGRERLPAPSGNVVLILPIECAEGKATFQDNARAKFGCLPRA